MKKVLFISYYFPPAGGSAVQRALKFVKYLPDFGWQPVVLTVREKDHMLLDLSLEQEIPSNTRVFRAPAPDLYHWFNRLGRHEKFAQTDISSVAAKTSRKKLLVDQLALFMRAAFFIPDARIGWLPNAVRMGKEIVRKERIDAVFTTSPPFTTAWIGGKLSKKIGLPWISDYRDPWTGAYFYFKRPFFSQKMEEALENTLLQKASKLIAINKRVINHIEKRYGTVPEQKKVVISNGYDPEDFVDIESPQNDKFTITYTGTQNAQMNAVSFIRVVDELAKEKPEFKKNLQVNFIGRMGDEVLSELNNAFVFSNIQCFPHLVHRECLQYTCAADLLLLLIPETTNKELIVTGKIFEYLYSGNPILCLSAHGDAAEIVSKTKSGFTVSPSDSNAIQYILWASFQRWKKKKPILDTLPDSGEIQKYDRKILTKQLADVLNRVTN